MQTNNSVFRSKYVYTHYKYRMIVELINQQNKYRLYVF